MLRPTGASSSSALQWTNALVTYAALLACCLYSGQRLQISFATYLSREVKSKLLHCTVHSPRGMEHSVVLNGRLCFVRHTQSFDQNMQRLFDLPCIWKIQFSAFCSTVQLICGTTTSDARCVFLPCMISALYLEFDSACPGMISIRSTRSLVCFLCILVCRTVVCRCTALWSAALSLVKRFLKQSHLSNW